MGMLSPMNCQLEGGATSLLNLVHDPLLWTFRVLTPGLSYAMLYRLSCATPSRRFLKRIFVFGLARLGAEDSENVNYAENEQICRYSRRRTGIPIFRI